MNVRRCMRFTVFALFAVAVVSVVAGCSTGTGEEAATEPASNAEPRTEGAEPPVDCLARPDECSLADVARQAGFLVGAATDSDLIDDPAYADVLAAEFNSLTAEREMKWQDLQPARGEFDFAGADEVVDFARANEMEVKGHTLLWAQQFIDATPDWVEEITDPAELRAVMRAHFAEVLGHFGDSVDRWDVVNEPLETLGTGVYDNHFRQVLGDGYIDEAFLLADELAPDTRLFINEAAVENSPQKAEALYQLVSAMVQRGVPIDGVGLQGHFLGDLPAPGSIEALLSRFGDLGLEVAITELDVVTPPSGPDPQAQAGHYEQVVSECIAAGCREVTVWGVHDAQSWLDDFLNRDNTDPLLFDDELEPKAAYDSTKRAIAGSAG
ncbi:MAG: 1,4-beta-xylanase [Actinomycetia bacterium]|nr:1,4-beta-xylanase [Actinomycetes bacterium]